MINVLTRWFNKYFSDPQAVLLAILLIGGFTVIMTMSQMLAPVLASMIIAYMLEGIVKNLEQHIPRFLAVFFVYMAFMTLLMFILLVLMPLLYQQTSQFLQELPTMIAHGHQLLLQLPERYPDFITVKQIESLINSIRSGVRNTGQSLLSYSLASIPILITVLVYFILVPLLVFFFLKDKKLILNWLVSFLPKERHAANRLWREMDAQMGNYIRGKVYEIFIVGTASYVTFTFMGLNYTPLLAVLVGLSVIIPYVGATLATLPVVMVAYFQWGWSSEFLWTISAYGMIQALDGNVLVPLLFSEAVNLHPVAIIVAVLVFGGLWGVWGVFFAIPLATLVKALLRAWPRAPVEEDIKL
ncbi:AI-2E family transporter [Candidatus Albibeggiatoa sp. nov. BB20]|uniref:AI-2E family transporter n=1 Tax=Candidatus Albibeggiatoa sp. nov. BB20 TaxID=3162723 RepID=UPI0033658E26